MTHEQGPGESEFGGYFLPEPEGTEQPPETPIDAWVYLARKGSRYAKPSDPWPEIPDAGEVQRAHAGFHAEVARSKPLLDDDEERAKLAATAIHQVLREALPLASLDSLLRATKRLVARLREPLDA